MVKQKTLLILSFTDLSRDPRVNRQIRILRQQYSLICAGTADPSIDDVAFVKIPPFRRSISTVASKARAATLLLTRRFEKFYWGVGAVVEALRQLSTSHLDGVVANDIDSLPVALRVAKGAPVIFDAHEYFPRQFEDRLVFRLFIQNYRTHLCRRYMPHAEATMTVSDGIADEYSKELGLRPKVIWSLPDYEPLTPQSPEEGVARLIHHGGASRSRRLEELILAMDHLDERFELYLMLMEVSRGYLSELKRLAGRRGRVHFLDPVAMPEIVRSIHRFDLGIHLLPASNFNQEQALPNKFFEFLQARLGIVVGPSPEMAKIVREHDLGVVTKDFSAQSLAETLNRLEPEHIWQYKLNAHGVARQYSVEGMRQDLLTLVDEALS